MWAGKVIGIWRRIGKRQGARDETIGKAEQMRETGRGDGLQLDT